MQARHTGAKRLSGTRWNNSAIPPEIESVYNNCNSPTGGRCEA
jgi:hypothetical protein